MKEPEINLNGWQTVKAFAKSQGVEYHVASNWIRRYKMPVRTFPELNGLRLVHPDSLPKKG